MCACGLLRILSAVSSTGLPQAVLAMRVSLVKVASHGDWEAAIIPVAHGFEKQIQHLKMK